LHNHDLLVGVPYESELILVDIGAEDGDLYECVHDGFDNGEVCLCRRHKNNQVVRIQGEHVANGWSSKRAEQPTRPGDRWRLVLKEKMTTWNEMKAIEQ
jgi:hypothetical protein